MAPQDVVGQLRILEEERAKKKRRTIEKQIQNEIMRRIVHCQRKIKQRENEIKHLEVEIKKCHEQGKSLRGWWCSKKFKRKQAQLKELKRITPSSQSAKVQRMVGK